MLAPRLSIAVPRLVGANGEAMVTTLLQVLLQVLRFLQQFLGVITAFPEGAFDGLALDDALFQGSVPGGQVHRSPIQPFMHLKQVGFSFERGLVRLLNGGDSLGKENLRPLDDSVPAARCFQVRERSLVNLRHVQRLQPEPHRLLAQSSRRLQTGLRPLLQVFSQRRSVLS